MNFHGISRYLADYALLGPGILVTIAVSLLIARPLARRMGAPPAVTLVVAVAVGLIFSATLTPSREALQAGAVGTGQCGITPIDLTALAALFQFGDPAFNFLLYVPLGLGIGLLPRSHARTVALVAAFLLSPVIELTQLVVTALDRACQSSDVLDNLIGLVAGLAIGWILRVAIERAGIPDDRSDDRSVPQ